MDYIGETKPRLTEKEKQFFESTGFSASGKKKWRCPECGRIRVGNNNSGADMLEKRNRK